MNISFNKRILFSLLLCQFILTNNNSLMASDDSKLCIENNGTFYIPNGSSAEQYMMYIYAGSVCEIGDNTLEGATDGLCINQENGGSKSIIRGELKVNRDGSYLNNNMLIVQSQQDSSATIITTGLFVNQRGDDFNDSKDLFTIDKNGKLYCGAFPISINEGTGNWEYAKAASTGSGSESITINYWRNNNTNAEDYENRGGIINGFLYNDNREISKFYKYIEEDNKILQVVPSNDIIGENSNMLTLSDKKTFKATDGVILFKPGAILDGVNIDNNCNVTTSNPNIEAQIKRGSINLTKYIKISDDNEIQLYTDTNLESTVNKGHLLKGHFIDAEILLFYTNKQISSNNYATNLLTINNNIKGSNTNNTLFNNLTFTNCSSRIPNEYAYYYETKDEVSSNDSGTKVVTIENLNEQKRSLNANIYKLQLRDSYNNYLIVRKLFSTSSRNYTYHGLLDSDNKVTKLYEYNYTGNRINEYKYDTSGNTISCNKYSGFTNIDPPTGDYTITVLDLNDIQENRKKIPTDGLILKNKHGNNKLTFLELFNKYINYNCYMDLDNLSEIASDNNKNITFDTFDSIKKINTNNGTEENLANEDELTNDSIIKSYYKNIYIQLIGGNNITQEISNTYGSPLKNICGTLNLCLYNPWEYKINENSYNSYTGSIYRKLPSDIDNFSRITQIYQNYNGPAFNHYKLNFSNNKDENNNNLSEDDEKNKFINSEILNYNVVENNNNFSANGTGNKAFVSDKLSIGDGSGNTIEVKSDDSSPISNILTQHCVINENATFNLKGHMTIRILKKKDFTDNGFA